MEYPIIDTLTNAYIRNGWTGLDIVHGKNLLSDIFADYSRSPNYLYINNVVPENSTARFTFSDKDTTVDISGCYIGFVYEDLSISSAVTNYKWCINNGRILEDTTNISTQSSLLCQNVFIYPNNEDTFNKLFSRYNIMVELGTTPTPYEPYTPPTTDIFSRTRLPLIRYFPHPVIESLQRASDGTMTADDVQILRHYLTKFGIGNIELGRFHAINPNVSNDIKEIDLEPIPIDEPIKEKKTGEEDLNVKTE